MKNKQIALQDIFLEDERFRTSYYFSLENLMLSLKRVGLVSPPLVAHRNGHTVLVSGWKRILASLKLNISSLPVRVVEEEDDLKTFLLAFYENLAAREFGLLEKAEILSRLKEFGESEKNLVEHYLPLLHISPTRPHLYGYLDLSGLEPDVKRIIYEKNMPFPSAELLLEFSPQERRFLLPLLSPVGQNKQKEILEHLQEISKKGDIPARKIFVCRDIQEILHSEGLSSLQKSDKIRHLLRRMRYPTLAAWDQSFKELLGKLSWPKEITIHPSPFFEGEQFSVSFAFKDRKEFDDVLLKLQEVASKSEFLRIFEFT